MQENIEGIIYCYTNKTNGKKYIGQTIKNNYVKRHYRHKYQDVKNETAFSRAIAKYGYDNFTLEILEENIPTNELLSEREIFYIKELNAKVPNGYNLTDGGEGHRGYKRTPEDIAKTSGPNNHNYGKPMNPTLKEILREKSRRENWSEERLMSHSKRMKEAMAGENNHRFGTKMSEEHKEKLKRRNSECHSGHNNPSAKAVVCIELNKVFLTMKEVGQYLDIIGNGYCNISSCCRGKLRSYKGYTWRYATEEERESELNHRSSSVEIL